MNSNLRQQTLFLASHCNNSMKISNYGNTKDEINLIRGIINVGKESYCKRKSRQKYVIVIKCGKKRKGST